MLAVNYIICPKCSKTLKLPKNHFSKRILQSVNVLNFFYREVQLCYLKSEDRAEVNRAKVEMARCTTFYAST